MEVDVGKLWELAGRVNPSLLLREVKDEAGIVTIRIEVPGLKACAVSFPPASRPNLPMAALPPPCPPPPLPAASAGALTAPNANAAAPAAREVDNFHVLLRDMRGLLFRICFLFSRALGPGAPS